MRSGFSNDLHAQAVLLTGDDAWNFTVNESTSLLEVNPKEELSKCQYSVYHNRDNQAKVEHQSLGGHSQCSDGSQRHCVLKNILSGSVLLMMCSSSQGVLNQTVAALYLIKCDESITTSFVKGSGGEGLDPSQWCFDLSGSDLYATGPGGPCRYGYITTMKQIESPIPLNSCILDESKPALKSHVEITKYELIGWLSHKYPLIIKVNLKTVISLNDEWLIETQNGRYSFCYKFPDNFRTPGLKLVSVCAKMENVKTGKQVVSFILRNHEMCIYS